jgi:hypothetical protein
MRLLHIGRATTNDIVISDQTVSRQHAQLIIDDLGQATLVDLNSGNGSFVNGKRITEARRLDPTDIVKVGEYLLPWRNYLQAEPSHVHTSASAPVAQAPAPVAQVAAREEAAMPIAPEQKPFPWKWIGLGAAALALIVVLVIVFTSGSATPKLDGKWHEEDEADNWINFGADGKYTEGFKNAVTYDSATWKAMGVDRILIQKGELEISRTYKFDDGDLLITQSGKMTIYEREKEK